MGYMDEKWLEEDWLFERMVTVGVAEDCRLGLEKGGCLSFHLSASPLYTD